MINFNEQSKVDAINLVHLLKEGNSISVFDRYYDECKVSSSNEYYNNVMEPSNYRSDHLVITSTEIVGWAYTNEPNYYSMVSIETAKETEIETTKEFILHKNKINNEWIVGTEKLIYSNPTIQENVWVFYPDVLELLEKENLPYKIINGKLSLTVYVNNHIHIGGQVPMWAC